MNWLPWKRAQRKHWRILIKIVYYSFTPNPERQPKYNWVSKLYDIETVFITKGTAKLNTIAEAKGKKIEFSGFFI